MIQDVSDQLFQKFTDAMRRELETPAAAPAPAPPPPVEAQNGPAPTVVEAPRPPAPSPAPPVPSQPAGEPALDVGALGAAAAGRAAGRMLRRPGFWIAVIVLAVLLFWFLSR